MTTVESPEQRYLYIPFDPSDGAYRPEPHAPCRHVRAGLFGVNPAGG